MATKQVVQVEFDFSAKDAGVKSAIEGFKKSLDSLKGNKNVDPIQAEAIERDVASITAKLKQLEGITKDGILDEAGADRSRDIMNDLSRLIDKVGKDLVKLGKASNTEVGGKKWNDAVKALRKYNQEIKDAQNKLKALDAIQGKKSSFPRGTKIDSDGNTTRKYRGDKTQKVKVKENEDGFKEVSTTRAIWAQETLDNSELDKRSKAYEQLAKAVEKVKTKERDATTTTGLDKALIVELQKASAELQEGTAEAEKFKKVINEIAGQDVSNLSPAELEKFAQKMQEGQVATQEMTQTAKAGASAISQLDDEFKNAESDIQRTADAAKAMDNAQQRIANFFSLGSAAMLFRRAMRDAIQCISDLDAAMTETAVVTDYTVGDMWKKLDEYTKVANELGATTQGAYETMTLYFQQGLNQQQAFEVGTETMKMARIAGMDYAETTDAMTAALRGFNMEINETSAQHINDVYSELAAITASDTAEISTAMSKTASIADSAGLDFDTASMYLAKAIETTREAPENIGTAMKTIVARYAALTKDPSTLTQEIQDALEGETVDYNQVTKALSSVGVQTIDAEGQFRDLGDVLLELNQRWDTLSGTQQHYIATQFAGNRQQSRFIAMMTNYSRTQELVAAANDSAGASNKQFEKTMDSLEAKVNQLTNSWNNFTMGIMNSTIVKGAVDGLRMILDAINALTGKTGTLRATILKTIFAFEGFKAVRNVIFALTDTVAAVGIQGLFGLPGKGGKNFKDVFKGNLKRNFGASYDGERAIADKIKQKANAIIEEQEARILATKEAQTQQDILQNELALTKTTEEVAQTEASGAQAIAEGIVTSEKEAQSLIEGKIVAEEAIETGEKIAQAEAQGVLVTETATELGLLDAINIALGTASALTKELFAFLGPTGALLIAVASAFAVIGLEKYFGIEGQIKRADSALKNFQETSSQISSDIDDITTKWDDLYKADLSGLTKGSLEWSNAIQTVNENVIELIEKYPVIADMVHVTKDGLWEISEEGQQAVLDTLQNQQKMIIESQAISSGYSSYLDALQAKTSKEVNSNSSPRQLAESTTWTREEKIANDRRVRELETQSAAMYKNAIAQMTDNSLLAKGYDYSKLKPVDITFADTLGKTLKQAREEYRQSFGREADESLSKQELMQMVAINNQRGFVQNDLETLKPFFNKIDELDLSGLIKAAKENNVTSNKLEEFLMNNGVIDGTNKDLFESYGGLEAFERAIYQASGTFSEALYAQTEQMRQINEEDSSRKKAQALNESLGLEGDFKLTPEQVEELWRNGTYQGIRNGYDAAARDLKNQQLDLLGSGHRDKHGDFVYDSGSAKKVERNASAINKMLGLTDKNAISAKTLSKNWDLVTKAINGSGQALAQLHIEDALEQLRDTKTLGKVFDRAGTSKKEIKNEQQLIQQAFKQTGQEIPVELQPYINQNGIQGIFDYLENAFANLELDADGNVIVDADTQAALNAVSVLIGLIRTISPEIADQMEAALQSMASLNGITLERTTKREQVGTVSVPMVAATGKSGSQYAYQTGNKNMATSYKELPIYGDIPVFNITGGGKKVGSKSPGGTSPSGGGGGGGGGSSSSGSEYKNPYDKFYNLVKRIEKLTREREKLNNKLDRMLKKVGTTSSEIAQNYKSQFSNLRDQISLNQQLKAGKEDQVKEVLSKYGASLTSKYVSWDYDKNMVQINWDAFQAADGKKLSETGQKTLEHMEEVVSKLEEIQGDIEGAEDAIENAEDTITELVLSKMDEYADGRDQVYQLVVDKLQRQIDQLSSVNESIDNGNQMMMDALHKAIDEQRKARENEKTEKDLADKQARLNYLKRDTSGANAVEIKKLEKELADAQENYTNSLVDQKLDSMQSNMDEASEARQRQIDLLQSLLDWNNDHGVFWDEVDRLIREAYEDDDTLGYDDEIIKLWEESNAKYIGQWQERSAMVELNGKLAGIQAILQELALEELKESLKLQGVSNDLLEKLYWIIEPEFDRIGQMLTGGVLGRNDTGTAYGTATYDPITGETSLGVGRSAIQEYFKINNLWEYFDDLSGDESNWNNNGPTMRALAMIHAQNNGDMTHEEAVSTFSDDTEAAAKYIANMLGVSDPKIVKDANGYVSWSSSLTSAINKRLNAIGNNLSKFKTGGLADFTGPAWLDGTPSQPELVLNARDTENFIQLKEILSSALNGGVNQTSSIGDTYYEIAINVDSIGSDYDVDQIAKRLEQKIMNNASYRNVNAIGLRR